MARNGLFNSPKGFWPNPDQEPFHKCQTPPWEVPRKRKTGGLKSRYNHSANNESESDHEKIVTRNKFYLLNPDLCESESVTSSMNKNKNSSVENTPTEMNFSSNRKYDINCNLFSRYYTSDSTINYNDFDNRFALRYKFNNELKILM